MTRRMRRRLTAILLIGSIGILGAPPIPGAIAAAETADVEAPDTEAATAVVPSESPGDQALLQDFSELQVSGGVDAAFAPEYMARIVNSSANGSTLCTGTLVSREWVITAAHCIDVSASTTVTLGRLNVNNSSEGITRSVTTKLVDSRWDAANQAGGNCTSSICDFDVGIMRLNTPVPNDWDVAPVPPDSYSAVASVDQPLYRGYGLTQASPPVFATRLQETRLGDFELLEPCFSNPNTNDFWCFEKQAGARTEGGDSGGPWMLAEDGNWMLFAVHSGIIVSSTTTWSVGTATEDLSWLRSTVGITVYPTGTVLRDSSTEDAFVVRSNGFRRAISASTAACLEENGANVLDLARSTYTTVPLESGGVSCVPSRSLFAVSGSNEAIGSLGGAGQVTLLDIAANGSASGSQSIHQGSTSVPGANETGDGFGFSTVWADVDGNGTDDLVIGSPFENIGSIADAGAITVVFDPEDGVGAAGSQAFYQGSTGMPGTDEANDLFGYALAAGDFDGDGYDDVAIGSPGEDIGSIVDAGAVTVLFGTPSGLTTSGAQVFHQDSSGVPGNNEAGDEFGYSLATAGATSGSSMFVAIGAPGEDIGSVSNAGSVTIMATGNSGLSPTPALFYQGASASGVRPKIGGASEAGDFFGFSLAGHSDGVLAIGAPFENIGSIVDAGAVTLYDGYTGTPRARGIFQGTTGVPSSDETNDLWGYSLSANVVGNASAIVVGAPGEDIGSINSTGAVTVLPNVGASGSITGATAWYQGSPGVPGADEAGDNFGFSVDLSSTGALFIGIPGEDIGSATDTGAGVVLFGTPTNPDAGAIVNVNQGTTGVPGASESGDFWSS